MPSWSPQNGQRVMSFFALFPGFAIDLFNFYIELFNLSIDLFNFLENAVFSGFVKSGAPKFGRAMRLHRRAGAEKNFCDGRASRRTA
jgi:hypothetical protein